MRLWRWRWSAPLRALGPPRPVRAASALRRGHYRYNQYAAEAERRANRTFIAAESAAGAHLAAAKFKTTSLRTGDLSHRLRPLGQNCHMLHSQPNHCHMRNPTQLRGSEVCMRALVSSRAAELMHNIDAHSAGFKRANASECPGDGLHTRACNALEDRGCACTPQLVRPPPGRPAE